MVSVECRDGKTRTLLLLDVYSGSAVQFDVIEHGPTVTVTVDPDPSSFNAGLVD